MAIEIIASSIARMDKIKNYYAGQILKRPENKEKLMDMIRAIDLAIEAMQNQNPVEINDDGTCPVCGAIVPESDFYCGKCGKCCIRVNGFEEE